MLSLARGTDMETAGATWPRSDSRPLKMEVALGPLHQFGFGTLDWPVGIRSRVPRRALEF